eukprot:2273093-Rhodomonas_salina.4
MEYGRLVDQYRFPSPYAFTTPCPVLTLCISLQSGVRSRAGSTTPLLITLLCYATFGTAEPPTGYGTMHVL